MVGPVGLAAEGLVAMGPVLAKPRVEMARCCVLTLWALLQGATDGRPLWYMCLIAGVTALGPCCHHLHWSRCCPLGCLGPLGLSRPWAVGTASQH